MDYPVVDDQGELVETRTASSVSALLASVPQGRHVLIVEVPTHPAWWNFDSMAWVDKPIQPSPEHVWSPQAKAWLDPRTPDQIRQQAMDALRRRRDQELSRSDLVALRSLEALLPPAVRAWRKALRDLPETVSDPLAPIELPPEPAGY